jgi:hypothetical protein
VAITGEKLVRLARQAGTHSLAFVSFALLRIDNYKPVISLRNRTVPACFNARGILTVIAEHGNVMHPHLRNGTADVFLQLEPELPCFRLRFGIGCPVAIYMLVFARQLAGTNVARIRITAIIIFFIIVILLSDFGG